MAESMVSIVVGLVIIVTGIMILSSHHRRELHKPRPPRTPGQNGGHHV